MIASRLIHQITPNAAAAENNRQMPMSTGPKTCDTRSIRMNVEPQTTHTKTNAKYAMKGINR